MVKLVAVKLVTSTRFKEKSTRVGLNLPVRVTVLGTRIFPEPMLLCWVKIMNPLYFED